MLVLPAGKAGAAIRVVEVANGASAASVASGAGLAPGSIFWIRGDGLGPAQAVQAPAPYPKRLPDAAGGTRVLFRSTRTGRAFPAPLISSVSGQVVGVVPAGLPLGKYTATAVYRNESASSEPFLVVRSSPGVFALSTTGAGPGVVQNYELSGATVLNSLTRPARAGDSLLIWGTGLGEVSAQDRATIAAEDVDAGVWVAVGSHWIRPSYAGPAPGLPGVDQINVALPPGFVDKGCYVPLQVTANGSSSNTVTIAVSTVPGTCEHPMGFSAEILQRLDAGGRLALGEVNLRRTESRGPYERPAPEIPNNGKGPLTIVIGSAAIRFSQADALGVFPSSGIQPPAEPGGCRPLGPEVENYLGWALVGSSPFLPLDAGPLVTATDPGKGVLKFKKLADGEYPPWLLLSGAEEGVWRFAGAGGVDVGPFETQIRFPPTLVFSLHHPVNLKTPVDVTWPATALDDFQNVTIGLKVNVTIQDGHDTSPSASREVSCSAPATRGRLTIPVEILQSLPSGNDGSGSITFDLDSKPVVFTAAGLEYGVVRASVSQRWSIKVN